MRLRVLDTGPAPARWNVAASAALLAGVDEGAPAVLRLHRYPLSCVLGRFQDAATELDLDGCRRAGVEVARRVTGGGAVAMGPGVLAFDLVLPGDTSAAAAAKDRAGDAIVRTLSDLGLAASRPSPGSVAIGGLKVSGSAGRLARGAMLHQATLILDLGDAPPLSLLRRRTEGGRPTPDPRHRVTDLASALRDPLAVIPGRSEAEGKGVQGHAAAADPLPGRFAAAGDDTRGIADRLVRRIAEAFGLMAEPEALSGAERARADAILRGGVGCDGFVLGGETERRAA